VKVLAGLVLGAALGIVISCGGAQQTQQGTDPNQIKRIEIANLWTQIRQWRSEAKDMDLDPPTPMIAVVRGQTVREIERKACPDNHAVPTTCNDICSLADNICDNAERICTLADELGKNDDFAQGKCTSAKASCREAKQRCCGCSDKDPAP
jgi:hypothetical protein